MASVVAIAEFHPWTVNNQNPGTAGVTPERDDSYITGIASLVTALGLTTAGIALVTSGGTSVDVR